MKHNRNQSLIYGLTAGLLFGIATPFSKTLLSHLNSFQLAGLLYLGAMFTYFPFILKNRKREWGALKAARQIKTVSGIVLFGGLLGPVLILIALKTANASSVSVWLNLELVATAILGALFFKEHFELPTIVGLLLALAAGVLVTIGNEPGQLISALLVTAACFSWGIDNHLTAIVDGASPETISFIKGLFAGAINLTIGSLTENKFPSIEYILPALLLGTLSYGISILLYVKSAQGLGATRSQILFSTSPFWGIMAAFIFLNEPLNATILIAVLLLILGIIFSNINRHYHVHTHKAITHIHPHSHNDGHHEHSHPKNDTSGEKHTHLHTHEPVSHEHPHYPDMHHRHKH